MRTTVSFVNLGDVYSHLSFTVGERDSISAIMGNHVTYGDAYATLVESDWVLNMICEAIEIQVPWRKLEAWEVYALQEKIARKYRELVKEDDFINMEY